MIQTSQLKREDISIPDLNEKAHLLFTQKKFQESLDYYQLTADLNPNEPVVWNNLGNNFLMLNNLQKAF